MPLHLSQGCPGKLVKHYRWTRRAHFHCLLRKVGCPKASHTPAHQSSTSRKNGCRRFPWQSDRNKSQSEKSMKQKMELKIVNVEMKPVQHWDLILLRPRTRMFNNVSGCSDITSGAMKSIEPQNVAVVLSPNMPSLHRPKSASFTCPSLSNSTFSNFKSLQHKTQKILHPPHNVNEFWCYVNVVDPVT